MVDALSPQQRSYTMSNVKSHGNISTEIRLIKFLKKQNIIGWRRKWKLFGKPDFVFPQKRLAIFVDGCFWHGHTCRNLTPQSNREYWENKIRRNKKRDKIVTKTLRQKGWTVIRLWECQIKNEKVLLKKLAPSFLDFKMIEKNLK